MCNQSVFAKNNFIAYKNTRGSILKLQINPGLYIFDIFNLDYLLKDDHITQLTIDWLKQAGKGKIRDIQYSTIDKKGILASYTTSYQGTGGRKAKISKSAQTLQIYTAPQLKEMLQKNGFTDIKHCAIDGTKFIKYKTERMLTIAKKKSIK